MPATPTTAPAVEEVIATPVGPKTLTVWLPPDFRPDNGSEAGKLLQQRLTAFQEEHPDTEIVVRIKAAAGQGGIRDSLAVTASAAPEALPDLVLIGQTALRASALKGLVYDIRDLVPASAGKPFPYAASFTEVDGSIYGVPFAGDAIVLASRRPLEGNASSWPETLSWDESMHVPLADSRSLFSFFCYFAAGGKPFASAASLALDPAALESALTWLVDLQSRNLLAADSLQTDSLDGALNALSHGGGFAVTRYAYASGTRYIFAAMPPTPGGDNFSLATGWAWAMANPDPAKRRQAAALLAWLSDPAFQAEWTRAQGLIPATEEGLQAWPDGAPRRLADNLSRNAAPYPAEEITAAVGPLLNQAIRWVLIDSLVPGEAALRASQALNPR